MTPRLPIAASAGRARSSAAALPPTRKSSSPDAACVRLPVTGASSSSAPARAAWPASSVIHAGESVLDSTSTAPRARAGQRAVGAQPHRLETPRSSATMLMTMSAPVAASRGVAAATRAACDDRVGATRGGDSTPSPASRRRRDARPCRRPSCPDPETLSSSWRTSYRIPAFDDSMARRGDRERGDCDQLSRSPVAAGGRRGDPARHPALEHGVRRADIDLPLCLRADVRRRRRARRSARHASRVSRHHGVLVGRVREPQPRDGLLDARGEPAAARRGRGRRIPGGDDASSPSASRSSSDRPRWAS